MTDELMAPGDHMTPAQVKQAQANMATLAISAKKVGEAELFRINSNVVGYLAEASMRIDDFNDAFGAEVLKLASAKVIPKEEVERHVDDLLTLAGMAMARIAELRQEHPDVSLPS